MDMVMKKNVKLLTATSFVAACAWITSASASPTEMKWVLEPAGGFIPTLTGVCNLAPVAGYEDRSADMVWDEGGPGRGDGHFNALDQNVSNLAFELTILNATEVVFAMKDGEGVVKGVGTADVPLEFVEIEPNWLPSAKGERTGAFLSYEHFPVSSRTEYDFSQITTFTPGGAPFDDGALYNDIEASGKIRLNANFHVADKDFKPDPTKSYTATVVVTCVV
jgi:hypothetical protein